MTRILVCPECGGKLTHQWPLDCGYVTTATYQKCPHCGDEVKAIIYDSSKPKVKTDE